MSMPIPISIPLLLSSVRSISVPPFCACPLVTLDLIRVSSPGPISSTSVLCYLDNLKNDYTYWYWFNTLSLIGDNSWIFLPHDDGDSAGAFQGDQLSTYRAIKLSVQFSSCHSLRVYKNTLLKQENVILVYYLLKIIYIKFQTKH